MKSSLRQKWDTVKDQPDIRPDSLAQEGLRYQQACSRPIPEFRAKLVTIAGGQSEISVTSVNRQSVINARMGINPLLDYKRKLRSAEEQEERDIENRQRATKNARQRVRYLIKAMQADHMLTFSYRENVLDRAKIAADWHEFVRLFRVRFPEWRYVSVNEKQDRGSIHLHVAVHGKQDIRWLLRCWLIAIGQPSDEVSEWLVGGVKLGERSLGAVNVQAPKTRWGGKSKVWKRDKLAGYLTKYIGKEFEETDKNQKKYWASRNIERPVIERFWLRATTYVEAVQEAHDIIYYSGVDTISMWGDYAAGVIWITGETDRENIGKRTRGIPDSDLLQ